MLSPIGPWSNRTGPTMVDDDRARAERTGQGRRHLPHRAVPPGHDRGHRRGFGGRGAVVGVAVPASVRPAQAHRRRRGGRRRGDLDRKPEGRHAAARRPRRGHGLPVVRAVPAPVGRRQPRVPAAECRRLPVGDAPAGARGQRTARARRAAQPAATSTVRRPAAARGVGPGHRPPAEPVPARRAPLEPRRQAPGPHAFRADPPAHPARRHERLRHPRPGGGDDHGPPRRRPRWRSPPPDRHA